MDLKYIIWNYQYTCLAPNCLKDFLQKPQVNGHPTVWACKCIFKASGFLKDFLHTAHTNGHFIMRYLTV